MKKVLNFKESEPEKIEYIYDLILDDGHSSKIKLIKEIGEWVLVGDNRQHLCQDELESILEKITDLNDDVYDDEEENDIDLGDCN